MQNQAVFHSHGILQGAPIRARFDWKQLVRSLLRAYLTHSPFKLGRYPLMMGLHKFVREKTIVECDTKDRGRVLLNLDDEAQFPLYYNNFEHSDLKTFNKLLQGAEVVIDVGANIGQYSLLFARKVLRVIAFEPLPQRLEQLRRNIALNDLGAAVEVVPKALSSLNGKLEFMCPESEENGGTGSTILGRFANSEVIQVEATTLDDYLESRGIEHVDLIKMDVEGGELEALRGMQKLLSRDKKPALILELNKPMMTLAGYTSKDVIDFLAPFGYRAFSISKQGIHGPLGHIEHYAENYCFVTSEHLESPQVSTLLKG